ncbi:MAG TPA: MucBP domain-containing protein, partial [Candidatus Limiplasma sp.]|nr:MucBP domain-containing protein [Candidatus Limiplasma sp.]
MKHRAGSSLRRLAAWTICLMMALWQFAAPALALTGEELASMPTVSVNYKTAEDGEMTSMAASPTTDPTGNKAYWVTVPVEAFSFPMTLSIVPNGASTYTFDPPDGTEIMPDATVVDYTGAPTLITAYQEDGVAIDTYYLYVSAAAMPPEVAPASVPVQYVDADDPGNVLYSTTFTAYYNANNVVTVDPSVVPEGYTLQGDDGVAVTVDETGAANPSSVTFLFSKPQTPKKGTVTVSYTDAGGNELANTQTLELDPG